MSPFQEYQLAFTEYLRRTESDDNTEQKRPRQQQIYRDLVYKNINQCIADVFPITKNSIPEPDWETMIREFINVSRLQTPYFLEICQEFLAYLMHTRKPQPTDHSFALELAHFEWIQLAVHTANVSLSEYQHNSAFTECSLWRASPLVVGLTYSYPVHIIDECYIPKEPGPQPTYLLVYRNRNDDLKVLEVDNLSLRIIQLLQAHENITHTQIFQLIATELGTNQEDVSAKALPILSMLAKNETVFSTNP